MRRGLIAIAFFPPPPPFSLSHTLCCINACLTRAMCVLKKTRQDENTHYMEQLAGLPPSYMLVPLKLCVTYLLLSSKEPVAERLNVFCTNVTRQFIDLLLLVFKAMEPLNI